MLQYQVFHDLLTGLPNRLLFSEHLSTALANAARKQNMVAILFLDLDRFKKINDTLGHVIGDLLLQAVSERLKVCLRSGDTIARWGGDEFTVLLPRISSVEEVTNICQRIIKALQIPFSIKEHELYISTTIGVTLYPQDGSDSETLLRNADAALHRTKEQGRNNYRFYSPTINFHASVLLKIENHLHNALEHQELLLHYQPQINIKTRKILGLEALLRWQHPKLGLVPPDKFIPLAEETGLIVPIGEWVIETACNQSKQWQLAGLPPTRISVNISPRQFQQSDIVKTVSRILQKTELEPHLLALEITETTIMQNVELACQALKEFQKMGVKISMDDFGTGYSSLGYLKKFPFNSIKIDQSFVRAIKQQADDIAIISAVIALGHGLNLQVIAEGVETNQQLNLLQSLKCEDMQGYLFSPPLNTEEATVLLFKSSRVNKLPLK